MAHNAVNMDIDANALGQTLGFRSREQKTPGEILRWFSEKFYLMHLYNNNKLTYEEIKTTPDPMGRAGQQPPDNG